MDLNPCNGCDECGLRCEAGVPMSREEFDAVENYIRRAHNRREIEAVTRQDKSFDLGDGVSVDLCRYRDMNNGRCMVYPARPLMCRLMGHLEWMPCPISKVKKHANTPDALALMQVYAEEPRRTFEQWETANESQ
jgi:Fe-S-cluster containining protein